MTTTLRTARLILRVPCVQPEGGADRSDVDAIYQACQDRDIQRFTLVPVPYTRADAEHFVTVVAPSPGSVTRVMITPDGELAGCIGIDLRDDPDGLPTVGSVGYWTAPGFRGRGYMTEALRAVVDDAFTDLGLRKLRWSALAENQASARVAARAGFRFTGPAVERGEQILTAELDVDDDRAPRRWPASGG